MKAVLAIILFAFLLANLYAMVGVTNSDRVFAQSQSTDNDRLRSNVEARSQQEQQTQSDDPTISDRIQQREEASSQANFENPRGQTPSGNDRDDTSSDDNNPATNERSTIAEITSQGDNGNQAQDETVTGDQGSSSVGDNSDGNDVNSVETQSDENPTETQSDDSSQSQTESVSESASVNAADTPTRNDRDSTAIDTGKLVTDFAKNTIQGGAEKYQEHLIESATKYADEALAAGQNSLLRNLGKLGLTEAVNGFVGEALVAKDVYVTGRALGTVQVCNSSNPNCPTPPPSPPPEPAACDPNVVGDCLNLDKAPCSPAPINDATCTSGDVECTQTLLEHDIFCTAKTDDGGFINIVYFTPPGIDPQIVETRCSPNPTPPPFNTCTVTSK